MNKKKLTSLSLSLAMTAGLFSGLTAQAAQYYPDVDEGHWAYEWVGYMNEHGYISGYPDGNYYPSQDITRAEYITILNKMFESNGNAGKNYADVHEGDWFYNQIQAAVAAGYLHGYDDANDENNGTMKPNNYITREEAAVILSLAYGLAKNDDVSKFSDADQISDWAVPYVGALVDGKVLMGDAGSTAFRPKDNMLRAEVACMLAQAKQKEDDLKYEEKVTLPEALTDADGTYTLSDISTKNIPLDKKLKLSVDAVESGNVGNYKIIATIDAVTIGDNVTLEGLKNILNEMEFSADELEKLSISFTGFDKPEKGSSLKLTVKATSGDKEYDSKEYTIAFGEQIVVWPSAAKNSNNQYTITGIDTESSKDMILSITEKVSGTVGNYTIDATIGDTELATGVTLDELTKILAERKLSAQDLKSLKLVIKADSPANGSSLSLTFRLADAETNEAIGVEKVYDLPFGQTSTGGGTLSGGSGGRVFDESRDRVVESLKDYQSGLLNANSSRKIASDKSYYGVSNDMLKVVLTNDGMNTFDATEAKQAKDAKNVDTVYESIKASLGDKGGYYDNANLYKVYEDVITAVLADTTLDYKNASIATDTKKKYVELFRAMVKTVNGSADAAVTIYNDPANAGKTNDEKFELFKTEAINSTTSILNDSLTSFDSTEKTNIANCAIAYVTDLFNSNRGNETLQADLAAISTMTIENFAAVLAKYL